MQQRHTRSVFGIYFSVPAYYWDLFESSKVNPVFIDTMLESGYTCQVYPGATLVGPPFFRVVFRKIPNLNISTPGNTAWDRDRAITDNFIRDLPKYVASGKPFFSMVFYDLPHSFEITPEQLRFQPSWTFADYTKLNNDLDPTGFFNLYRNTCYETDKMLGDILAALDREGCAGNTVVIVTGDHAQEFNENRKNYWSHGGNFSRWQIQVPLIVHVPGAEGGIVRTHRTTHYDIVPTLMQTFLGVKNPIDDYSAGHLLTDTVSRDWHVVGSELNYGFIVEGDTILEKTPSGGLKSPMQPSTCRRLPRGCRSIPLSHDAPQPLHEIALLQLRNSPLRHHEARHYGCHRRNSHYQCKYGQCVRPLHPDGVGRDNHLGVIAPILIIPVACCTSDNATPSIIPATPPNSVIKAPSMVNMFETKLRGAPKARNIPMLPSFSITSIERVEMMLNEAITTMKASSRNVIHFSTLTMRKASACCM